MNKYMINATQNKAQVFFGPYDTEAKAAEVAKVLPDLGFKNPKVKVILTCSTVTDLLREARAAATQEA